MKFLPLKILKDFFTSVLLTLTFIFQICVHPIVAQNVDKLSTQNDKSAESSPSNSGNPIESKIFSGADGLRIEKKQINVGAELITIFADLSGGEISESNRRDVPLLSILRDTLGDEKPENDRLRYVWLHNFTEPSLTQKIASGIPFFYKNIGTNNRIGDKLPQVSIDLNPSNKNIWNNVFRLLFKQIVLSQANPLLRTSVLQYQNNQKYARQTALMSALALLSIFQTENNERILSDAEIRDIHAKIKLSDSLTGAFVQKKYYSRVYQKSLTETESIRGHNWELLRQSCDSANLYFEPLQMPDGSATHAIVWVASEDLKIRQDKSFDSRFLNLKNPWKDARLRDWNGYREVRFYDEENRQVAPDDVHGKPKTMIPLAIYGLDFPKIPVLLVDFRNNQNPRSREISKRLLDDLTRNLLAVSSFGNLPYFFGRTLYEFVTARRGIDLNQASRSGSFSQLQLLLLLDESLDKNFKSQIRSRLDEVSINPLDSPAAPELARRQYANLIAYSIRPDGLPKKIENDRREELAELKHNRRDKMFFSAAHFFTFGRYTHRERQTGELANEIGLRRELDFHERFLSETAKNSSRPEIDGDLDKIKKSLVFIAENGYSAHQKTVKTIARLFKMSGDQEIRQLALNCLNGINSLTAKNELLLIYRDEKIENYWRNQSAEMLNLAPFEDSQFSADSEK